MRDANTNEPLGAKAPVSLSAQATGGGRHGRVEIKNHEKYILDLSIFPSGIYFIRSFDGQELLTFKIVKQND